MLHNSIYFHHDRSLRDRRLTLLPFLIDHPEADQAEILSLSSQGLLNEELKGSLRGLELVSLAFEILDPAQDLVHRMVVAFEIDPVLLRFVDNVAPAGQVRDQNPLAVPHELGIDMFIGFTVLENTRYMESPLMGKRAIPHIGLVLVRHNIGKLVKEVRDLPELL